MKKWSDQEIGFMQRALELASSQLGKTSPDPLVGAVVAKGGVVISEGYHSRVRTPHAEAWAIKKAGKNCEGATIYVNLEPCCYFRTKNNPPCVQAIISSGIKKVIVSMVDPNPQVSGRGIKELKEAGIDVEVGLLEAETRKLNEVFIKYITTNHPFVTLKSAMSLDGKIAAASGDSFWITGLESREHTHFLRSVNDAVMVGIQTIQKDDSELNVRHIEGDNPLRVIIDPKLEISLKSKVLTKEPSKTIICALKNSSAKKRRAIEKTGAEILLFSSKGKKINLKAVMDELGKKKITSVLLEGGGSLNASALQDGIVDKVNIFIAPKIIGGRNAKTPVEGRGVKKISEVLKLSDLSVKHFGHDLMIEGYLIDRRTEELKN